MKYFLDAEFIEDGRTIDLISIGIVAQDGREYYAISTEFDPGKANKWVRDNVLCSLPPRHPIHPMNGGSTRLWEEAQVWKSRNAIATELKEFLGERPEIWGEWCDYDWVALCQLFGTMNDLPKSFPMRCRDVIQFAEDDLGVLSSSLPASLETEGNHNALLGARTVKARYEYLYKLTSYATSKLSNT